MADQIPSVGTLVHYWRESVGGKSATYLGTSRVRAVGVNGGEPAVYVTGEPKPFPLSQIKVVDLSLPVEKDQVITLTAEKADLERLLDVKRLALRPGDRIVLEVPMPTHPQRAAYLTDMLRQHFPDHDPVVIVGGELKVIGPDEGSQP